MQSEIVTVTPEQELEYWRETALLSELAVDKIMASKSLHEKVKVYNQYQTKRRNIEMKHVDVLQAMFSRIQEKTEKPEVTEEKKEEGSSSLPEEKS